MSLVDSSAPEAVIPFGPVTWHPEAAQIATLSPFVASKERAALRGVSQARATRMLLNKVMLIGHQLIPHSQEGGTASAPLAVESGEGCCIASTKITTGLLDACSLKADTYYDGTHFWNGLDDPSGQWYVDGYYAYVKRGGEPTAAIVAPKAQDGHKYQIGKPHDGYQMIDEGQKQQPHLLDMDSDYEWTAVPLNYSDTLDLALGELKTTPNASLYVPHGMAGIFMRDLVRSYAAKPVDA